MKLIKMICKNVDGKVIEKEIEERLVSTYQSMGWELKGKKIETEKVEEKNEKSFIPKKDK